MTTHWSAIAAGPLELDWALVHVPYMLDQLDSGEDDEAELHSQRITLRCFRDIVWEKRGLGNVKLSFTRKQARSVVCCVRRTR